MRTLPVTASTKLRELCTAAGDKVSLAIAMAGLVLDHATRGRIARGVAAGIGSLGPHRVDRRSDADGGAVLPGDLRQDSKAASGLTCCGGRRGSSTWPTVIPSKGNFVIGSPLAVRLAPRGYCSVLPGSSRMARRPAPRPGHGPQRRPVDLRHGRRLGLLAGDIVWRARADDRAMREIEDALQIAERSGDDLALAMARVTLGVALVHRHTAAERAAGRSCWPRSATCHCAARHTLSESPARRRVLGT